MVADIILIKRTDTLFKRGYFVGHDNGNPVYDVEFIGNHKLRATYYGDRNIYADIQIKSPMLFPTAEISINHCVVGRIKRTRLPIEYLLDYKGWEFSAAYHSHGSIYDAEKNELAYVSVKDDGIMLFLSDSKNLFMPVVLALAAMELEHCAPGKYDTNGDNY